MKKAFVGCRLSVVLLLAVALLASVASADVEYLNWMVDQSDVETPTEFAYAVLVVLDENVKVGYVMDPARLGNVQAAAADAMGINTTGDKMVGAILEKWQGPAYSFQLELYNESFEKIDYTGLIVSYEDLVHARFPGGDVGTHTWNAIGPAPVPEPTGGMLILFGLAALGLRRRRV